MNNIFLTKLKKALGGNHPLEAVTEVINEYDEIRRLVEWRRDVILNAKNLKRNQKELNRIAKMVEESGYHPTICRTDIDAEVRNYFRDL